MDNKNKTIAMGVIIAGILMLVYYVIPADGISFGSEASAASTKKAHTFVPPLSAPARSGGGGCGV